MVHLLKAVKLKRWVALCGAALALALPSTLLVGSAHSNAATSCSVNPGGVVFAEQCPGADAGAQIAAAIAALAGNSGVVNAQGIHDNLSITEPLTLGAPFGFSVKLLLGPGNWHVSQPIKVLMDSSIVGEPVGLAVGGTDVTATNLIAANGASLSSVVQMGNGTDPGAFDAVLQDVVVDGNKSNGGTSATGAAISISGAGRTDLTRVTAQNSDNDGILVQATPAAFAGACCERFTKVMAIDNNGNGLEVQGSLPANLPNDIMAIQSEFENNGEAGVLLDNASAFRVTNSDFGGNQTGLETTDTSGAQIITGNQFGNQKGDDILMNSPGFSSLIDSNYFIGSGFRQPGHDAIQLVSPSGDTIVGNFINMVGASGAANLAAGIRFVNGTSRNMVMSNTFSGGSASTDIVGSGVYPPNPQTENLFCRAAADSSTGC